MEPKSESISLLVQCHNGKSFLRTFLSVQMLDLHSLSLECEDYLNNLAKIVELIFTLA